MDKYTIFVGDTETNGFIGIPPYKQEILQICFYCISSNEWFTYICDPGLKYISPESINCHRITLKTIQDNGKPSKLIFTDFLEWVNKNTLPNTTPLMMAHNARFDHDVLMKSLDLILKVREKKLSWKWYCTLEAVKRLYPEIQEEFFPNEKPHSLGTLMEYFFPNYNITGSTHNAQTDVMCLTKIIQEKLIPKEVNLDSQLLSHTRQTLISDVRGFGFYRASLICKLYNDFFKDETIDSEIPLVPATMLTCCHLITLGMKKAEKLNLQGDVWFNICQQTEIMLRSEPLNIYSDNLILRLLSHMLERSEFDILNHTMKEDGDTLFFPTLPLSMICVAFLPLDLSFESAVKIKEILGFSTLHEMYTSFKLTPDSEKKKWIDELNRIIDNKNNEVNIFQLEAAFKKMLDYGGG